MWWITIATQTGFLIVAALLGAWAVGQGWVDSGGVALVLALGGGSGFLVNDYIRRRWPVK